MNDLKAQINDTLSIAESVVMSLEDLDPGLPQSLDNDFSAPLCYAEDLLTEARELMEMRDRLSSEDSDESPAP